MNDCLTGGTPWKGTTHASSARRRTCSIGEFFKRKIPCTLVLERVVSQIQRRTFLLSTGALLAASLARAQQSGRLPVLGLLSPDRTSTPEQLARSPVLAKLRELGWIEGKTFVIERAFGEGSEDPLPELAAELVRKRVDVIWTFGPEAAVAAARATKTIPIVFFAVTWPVEYGLVDSIGRPGRNVTGVAFNAAPEVIVHKPLEMLREIAPRLRRVAVIMPKGRISVTGGPVPPNIRTFELVAKHFGFELLDYPIAREADIEPMFAAILAGKAEAVFEVPTPLTSRVRKRIVEFTNLNRLPGISNTGEFVTLGGLLAYSTIFGLEPVLRSFEYVDRILRGTKPADLPVELPSRIELAINLKTAKALGLTIPQSVLLRADRVIE